MPAPARTTVRDLARCKSEGKRFAMLTAYDFPTARLLDEAGIPVLLVGDSLGQVVLGYDTTLPVTMDEMLHHCRAVARGARNALLIGDMPFGSYQVSVEEGIRNATRFLKEGGMHGVKIEGPNLELTQALTERGVPVMAHLGLTPQSVHALGGYRVHDPDHRHRRRGRVRRPGPRRPRPPRHGGEPRGGAEVREALRQPGRDDRRGSNRLPP
jgi:3-methyl-2-oxobutanoate hydroxymethyltransferase